MELVYIQSFSNESYFSQILTESDDVFFAQNCPTLPKAAHQSWACGSKAIGAEGPQQPWMAGMISGKGTSICQTNLWGHAES